MGLSLSQIGEFAFIIASVGVAQGVMPSYIYPVIIASSVITTFTTPYWIRAGQPVYQLLDRKMSPNLKSRLDEYCLLGSEGGKKDWKSIITSTLPRVLIFSVVSFSLLFVIFNYLMPFLDKVELLQKIPPIVYHILLASGILLIITPFLYGIVYNKHKTRELYAELVRENKSNVLVITVWTVFRFIIAGFFVFSVLVKIFSYTKWVIILITILVVIFMVFSNNTLRRFSFIESAFMKNLNAKDQVKKS